LPSKYKVVLSGYVLPEHDRGEVIRALAALFNSDAELMQRLVKGKETLLKKAYTRNQALNICKAIRQAGAECRMREMTAEGGEPAEDRGQPFVSDSNSTSDGGVFQEDTSPFSTYEASEAETRSANKENFRSRMARFIGSNADDYLTRFSRFGSPGHPKFALTWHWPALFCFFFWALYRKLWGWACVHFVGSLLLITTVSSPGVSLVWLLIWPLSANFIYFKHVVAKVENLPAEALRSGLRQGGVSLRSVWIGIVATLGLFVLVSNYIAIHILEKYGDQVGNVLPGSGSQVRGDGSILADIGPANSKLAKTSFSLSFLATSLKLLAVKDHPEKNRQVIRRFIERIEKNNIRDSWDTVIRMEISSEGYVISSAGPDRSFGTDDDILQKVDVDT